MVVFYDNIQNSLPTIKALINVDLYLYKMRTYDYINTAYQNNESITFQMTLA